VVLGLSKKTPTTENPRCGKNPSENCFLQGKGGTKDREKEQSLGKLKNEGKKKIKGSPPGAIDQKKNRRKKKK